jgi:polysaccharide biosynthesis transport protein
MNGRASAALPETTEPSLTRFFAAIRDRWLLLMLVFIPTVAAIAAYAQSLPATYQSIAVLSFAPKREALIAGDTLKLVLTKYVAFAASTGELNEASRRFNISASELLHNVDVSIPAETANLRIAVTLTSPVLAQQATSLLAHDTLARANSDLLLNAQTVQDAFIPPSPVGPNRSLYRAAGVVAGIILSLGAVALAEGLKPRILDADEAGILAGLDVWAAVPSSAGVLRKRDPLDDPRISASLRSVRNQLVRRWNSTPARAREPDTADAGRIVVITSPSHGQGTTTIATLLAQSMSSIGLRVLAVDAHFDHADLASSLQAKSAATLTDIMANNASVADLAATADGSVVVVGGDRDSRAQNALGVFPERLFGSAVSSFNVIIVDAPPLTAGEVARSLASEADDVLLVIGRRCPQDMVRDARDLLSELDVAAVVVANRVV